MREGWGAVYELVEVAVTKGGDSTRWPGSQAAYGALHGLKGRLRESWGRWGYKLIEVAVVTRVILRDGQADGQLVVRCMA